eukprot:471178-Hanusia_phi.AAC.1
MSRFGNPSNEALSTWTNKNWLKSRFHFSFAEYSNPKNSNFGVLRVMNDDLVQVQQRERWLWWLRLWWMCDGGGEDVFCLSSEYLCFPLLTDMIAAEARIRHSPASGDG